MEHPEQPGQVLQFIEKRKQGDAFVTVHDGTTNEEVLEMLIDRIQSLDAKLPNKHNQRAVQYLKSARFELGQRTRDRQKRGVEGTPHK
jgi:hypothetical protein